MKDHPMQRVALVQGVPRFVQNGLVRHLVDSYPGGLNALIVLAHGTDQGLEDYEQLMMLIGYSLSGYSELDCCSKERLAAAELEASRLFSKKGTPE